MHIYQRQNTAAHRNKTSQSKKPRSRSTHHANPDFIQLLPVSTQFPDSKMLPKSMKNMSVSDEIVNFYPVHKKGANYLKYCVGWLSNEEKPRSKRDCIFNTHPVQTGTVLKLIWL